MSDFGNSMKTRAISVQKVRLYFLPVHTRVPLKFGNEVLTEVTCVRVCLSVIDQQGNRAEGWGETPLSVQWVWPDVLPYQQRLDDLKQMCIDLAADWHGCDRAGHPIELGHHLIHHQLKERHARSNMPWLAALVCNSAFDIALHDAYGNLHGCDVYQTYNAQYMQHDLSYYLEPASDSQVNFTGLYPQDFLLSKPARKLPVWHMVGGKDPLVASELRSDGPDDGYPVLLTDWIQRDGLTCLKIKLSGHDMVLDYERIVRVGKLGVENGVKFLTTDFNCTVTDPQYVVDILDRLAQEEPAINDMLLYVEQPFPYDLEANQIDVHAVSQRKPLFMDESCHDWELIRLGRVLGWTGVALKTCKTQTGAILSYCWAKAHGMAIMVQDLTNPMLAQISHCQLASHVETIMGFESNAMQFYPDASLPEAAVHPGVFQRRNGVIDISTLSMTGMGYAIEKMKRQLPPATVNLD